MKKNDSLVCDSKEKAEILLDQFQSVFTRDGGSAPPHIDPPQHPIISDININRAGECKLLKAINPHKACGPNQIPNVIFKNCADTLAPALRDIFQRSLDTAVLPSDWRTANNTWMAKQILDWKNNESRKSVKCREKYPLILASHKAQS